MAGDPSLEDLAAFPELQEQTARATKVTLGEVYQALIRTRGNKALAARELGIRRSSLVNRIEGNTVLVALMNELRETTLDKAEDNIFVDVERGDPSSSRYLLSTLGKDRGYVQSVAGQGKDGTIEVTIRQFAPSEMKETTE